MNRFAAVILFAAFATSASGEIARRPYLVATFGAAPESIRVRTASGDVVSPVRPFRSVDGFAIELTDAEATALRSDPRIRSIEIDPERHAFGEARRFTRPISPTALAPQTIPWGIEAVKARQVWSRAQGQGIRIGICDTGLDRGHPDMAPRYRGGYDFVDNDDDPQDGDGHGTHVAGTIAATDDAGGVVGVAPQSDLYSLRVLNNNGRGTASNLIRAIDWAIENRLHILNFSLGSDTPSTLEEQATRRAADAGLIIIAASGNDADAPVAFPAAYPDVIAVGAIDRSQTLASFSTRGSQLDLVAPGVSVLSVYPLGKGSLAIVSTPNQSNEAFRLQNSPNGAETARFVYCGLGRPENIPGSVRGKIALIERGEITFAEKSKNATKAGALAVVIFDNIPRGEASSWTLGEELFSWILTVGVSYEDGQKLLHEKDATINVSSGVSDYAFLNGTSMSAPHVTAVAALLWSLDPGAPASRVIRALLDTGTDLGTPGFDTSYGNGLVNAWNAAQAFAPQLFNTGSKSRRRGIR